MVIFNQCFQLTADIDVDFQICAYLNIETYRKCNCEGNNERMIENY